MNDLKPPRLIGDERATVLALLQYQRESVVRKVAGVSEASARRQFVRTGTTLLWIVKHLSHAEILWLDVRFAGTDVENPSDVVTGDDSIGAAIEAYRSTWARTDAIVAAASLDDLTRDTGAESPVNLRWVLMHLLEETARHAGHADIIRELIDGEAGR
jgi:uncharacterized damage-inducible protein DinB